MELSRIVPSGFFARLSRAAELAARAGNPLLSGELESAMACLSQLMPRRPAQQNLDSLLQVIDQQRSITKGAECGLDFVDLELIVQLRALVEGHKQKNSPQMGGTYGSVCAAIDSSLRKEFGPGVAAQIFLALLGDKELRPLFAGFGAEEKSLAAGICTAIADAAQAEDLLELAQPFQAITEFFN